MIIIASLKRHGEVAVVCADSSGAIRWYRPNVREHSQGCFYDDCADHPEGAIAWALSALERKLGIVHSWGLSPEALGWAS